MIRELPTFTRQALALSSHSVGAHGEIIATALLTRAGYSVARKKLQHCGYDLVAVPPHGESIYVEVKTARRNVRLQWCFTLRKNDAAGFASHLYSDVVLLLAVLGSGWIVPFVIPTGDVRDKRAITISKHPQDYSGKYAVYRQSAHQLSLEVDPYA